MNISFTLALFALLSPGIVHAASEVEAPADGLSAECRGGDASPVLIVFRDGDQIYQTTPYRIPYNADDCINHQRHLQAMFNAAADGKTKISFRPAGNSPLKDFRISGNAAAPVPAQGLRVNCYGSYWKHLEVEDAGGKTIYETKEYSIPYNDDDCYRAVDQVRSVINSAKSLGKKVDFRFSGSPAKDIEVSNADAPRTSRSQGNNEDPAPSYTAE